MLCGLRPEALIIIHDNCMFTLCIFVRVDPSPSVCTSCIIIGVGKVIACENLQNILTCGFLVIS